MKKFLSIGIGIALLSLLISFLKQNWFITVKISGLIGISTVILAGVFSGAFISGDKRRANYTHENKEERKIRNEWSNKLLFIGLPNIIVSLFILFLLKR